MSVKMTPRSASKTEHRESAFIPRPMTGALTEAAGPRAPRLGEAGESPDNSGEVKTETGGRTAGGQVRTARLGLRVLITPLSAPVPAVLSVSATRLGLL